MHVTEPSPKTKKDGTGIIFARSSTITLQPGQGRAARQLHRGSDDDADADADADTNVPHQVLTWMED